MSFKIFTSFLKITATTTTTTIESVFLAGVDIADSGHILGRLTCSKVP